MLRPIIAIVGRPNVGKSTLFNRLIGRRRSLVRDVPGVTRDRLYGTVVFERWQATVVDTGGFDPSSESDLVQGVRRQVMQAVEEADLIVFVVDGRAGVTGLDEEIAGILRKSGRVVLLAVNKVDGMGQEAPVGDAYRLGFAPVLTLSAEHGRGVAELLEACREIAPATPPETAIEGTRVAIIGRPNVGKSSLVNRVLGHERVLVHAEPGTTRDAVDTPVTFRGHEYLLIDTAGIRRKGKVTEPLEKLAVVMALKSLERCQVAVLVIDATEGVAAQDAHIAGYANDAGRAVVVAVNKWDLVPPGLLQKSDVVTQIYERLPFLEHAPVCFTSAVTGLGLRDLFDQVDVVAAAAQKRVQPGELLATLRQAVERRPMSSRGVPLRVQSAQQVAVAPPTFALRVNLPDQIHFSYERYIINSLRHSHGFAGSPIRLLFRKAVGRGAGRPGRARRRASR
ncbi:MAG TPA: ribosome biogenesis GTPase Der [Candidatus Dormibacteraeota bacterium]|nr:ribosome biogenesis GTPase Der [Candidatus Dormibacteraeota bacterium]